MIEIAVYVLKALLPKIKTDSRVTGQVVTRDPVLTPTQKHGIPVVTPTTPTVPIVAKPPTAPPPTFVRSDKVAVGTPTRSGVQVYQRTGTGKIKPVLEGPMVR